MAILKPAKGECNTIIALKNVLDYIIDDKKVGILDKESGNPKENMTMMDLMLNEKPEETFNYINANGEVQQKLITGINCTTEKTLEQFMITKKMYNKEDGRMYRHFVHSYSKFEKDLTPEMAHEISLKLLEHEQFKGFQILVATHTDRDHLHTHFVINSVNLDTGKKWNQSRGKLDELREYSNKLCEEYGLKYSSPKIDRTKERLSWEEKKARERGKSWKYETFLAVNESRKVSTSKEEFIENLEVMGYKVRWEDSRKDIGFTFNKRTLNNDKLHPPENFTKEALLKQFEKNKEYQANKKAFETKVKRESLQEMFLKTVQFLFDNPDQGDKNYPLQYLEGQALKEKMIEESKGRGFDWEDEWER